MGAPYLLNPKEIYFPPAAHALQQPNGLLALGGDLSVDRLVTAYQQGIFPWFNQGDPILWWSPDPRMILFPENFKLSRSLRKILKQHVFHVTYNQAFPELIQLCAEIHAKNSVSTWITHSMQRAFINCHKAGIAHSIEVWQHSQLVGGLYGLIIDNIFCGESMVSTVSNASKVALFHLVELCYQQNLRFIDCQLPSRHLLSLGAQVLPRAEFLQLLQNNCYKAAC